MAQDLAYVNVDVVGGDGDGSSLANAYASQSLCVAGEAKDYSTAGNYGTWLLHNTLGGADTTVCSIDGSITGAATYIEVLPEATYRHQGIYDTSYYHMTQTDGNPLSIRDNYVRIYNLQVFVTLTAVGVGRGIQAAGGIAAGNDLRIIGNIIKFAAVDRGAGRGIAINDPQAIVLVQNNLIIDVIEDVDTTFYGIDITGGTTVNLYNNTIHNCYVGINQSGGTVTAIGNVIAECTSSFAGTITYNYNVHDEDDTTNSEAPSGAAWTNEFNNLAGDDFSIKNSGNVFEYSEITYDDDNNVPQDDIIGTARNTGAGEQASSGAFEYGAVENVEITHTADTIEFVPKTHTVVITPVAITHSSDTIEFVPKTNAPAVGVAVEHSSDTIEFVPSTNSVAVGVSINHTAIVMEFVPSTNTVTVGVAVSHSSDAIEFVPSTNAVAVGVSIDHSSDTIEFVPSTNTVTVGIAVDHSSIVMEFVPKTHTVVIVEAGAVEITHSADMMEFVPATHTVVVTPVTVTHSSDIMEFVPATHTVSAGVAVSHTSDMMEFVPATHTVAVGVSISHTAQVMEFVPSTNNVAVGAVIDHSSDTMEFVPSTNTVEVTVPDVEITHTAIVMEFIPSTNTVTVGVAIDHSSDTMEFIPLTHTVEIASPSVEVTHSPSTMEFIPKTHTVQINVIIVHSSGAMIFVPLTHTVTSSGTGLEIIFLDSYITQSVSLNSEITQSIRLNSYIP